MSVLWLGMCFGLQNTPVHAEVVDKIVAILDEELILLSEVREYMQKPVVRVLANLDTSDEREYATLHYMIERQLLFREIQYLAFPKEKELVKSLATQYMITTYYNNDAQAFTANVQAQGITEIELEQELTLYMKGVDYIRRKFRFNSDIDNPNVVLKLFRKWVADLRVQAKIQILYRNSQSSENT